MPIDLNGTLPQFGNILAAVSALGTAAFGLVDATKVFRGGVSNIGFAFVAKSVAPYEAALRLVDKQSPFSTIKANWLNGVPKADQKAAVKSLIRLGITGQTAADLAKGAPGVDGTALAAAATAVETGAQLTEAQLNVLGRFDAIVDAQLDAGFERADQKYRNSAKVIAAAFAIALAVCGMAMVQGQDMTTRDFILALFVGVVATPLAPIAKDISSALTTAVSAIKSISG